MTVDTREDVYAAHAAQLGCDPGQLRRYVRRARLGLVLLLMFAAALLVLPLSVTGDAESVFAVVFAVVFLRALWRVGGSL